MASKLATAGTAAFFKVSTYVKPAFKMTAVVNSAGKILPQTSVIKNLMPGFSSVLEFYFITIIELKTEK